jgi:Mrp family chromosome partitioning ATPase
VFNVPRKPGLTDFLGGQAPRESIIQATTFPGLTFIGCGARRQSGPELLGSPVMARFMASLRPAYDVILVDSSPLAAGVDPYALATLTGHLLLVLRTGVTNREVAGAKLDILGRLPVRVLGAVVNDVRPGIDHEQYSYYLSGYEAVEEGPSGARLRVLQGGERTGTGGDGR